MRLPHLSLLAFAALLPAPSQAALSGYYDSLEQIEVVLAAPDLGDKLRQLPVLSLRQGDAAQDGTLTWQVETQDCTLTVHLRPAPPAGAGGTPLAGKTSYQIDRIGECH